MFSCLRRRISFKRVKSTSIDDLPMHCLEQVLSYLPLPMLLVSGRVSRRWRAAAKYVLLTQSDFHGAFDTQFMNVAGVDKWTLMRRTRDMKLLTVLDAESRIEAEAISHELRDVR